jgi:glucose dehydrogenase
MKFCSIRKTTSLGKPVGKDSSLKTWNGDQWKIGGGTLWGGWSYDPEADLFYYGSANPSTWNPSQRAGADGKPIDQKWTMAIIARNRRHRCRELGVSDDAVRRVGL